MCVKADAPKCKPTYALVKSPLPYKLAVFLLDTSPNITNAEFTKKLISWAKKQGATCKRDSQRELTICSGLTSGVHFGNAATTLSDVVLTSKPKEQLSFVLLNHEEVHKHQWNRFYLQTGYWPSMLVYYFRDAITRFGNPCWNDFEREAEKAGKTYNCQRPDPCGRAGTHPPATRKARLVLDPHIARPGTRRRRCHLRVEFADLPHA